MLEATLFGSAMLILAVLTHSMGTAVLVKIINSPHRTKHRYLSPCESILRIGNIAVLLLIMHIAQIAMWACVYWQWIDVPAIQTFMDAFYFSMITYTTVGYGDIVIAGEGRLLSGFESINGILMFGWSTALLFAAVQKIWLDKPIDAVPQ